MDLRFLGLRTVFLILLSFLVSGAWAQEDDLLLDVEGDELLLEDDVLIDDEVDEADLEPSEEDACFE